MPWLDMNAKQVAKRISEGRMKQCINVCWQEGWHYQDGKKLKVIKTKSTQTKNHAEAELILEAFKKKMKQDKAMLHSRLKTFKEVSDEMIDELKNRASGLAKNTEDKYRKNTKNFLRIVGEEITLEAIDEELLNLFVREMNKKKVGRKRRGEEIRNVPLYVPASQRELQRWIKRIMNYAVKKKYTNNNIGNEMEIITKKEAEPHVIHCRHIEAWELELIFADEKLHKNNKIAFMGLLNLGCRLNELGNIRWKDIREEKGYWIIDIWDSKSKLIKRLPVSKTLKPYLEEYKAEQHRQDDFVFRMGKESKVNRKLYNAFIQVCDRNKINGVVVHSFRNTFIRHHIQAGVDFRTIMSFTGHKQLETFMIYLKRYSLESEKIDMGNWDNLPSF